jgi:hypothetical protein
LARAPGHPFYQKLNELLESEGFDEFVEKRCAKFYHPRTTGNMYPAVGALDEFGKKSLPVVLDVIKSSASTAARESAVSVWMFVYSDRAPKGVALLRQEARGTSDPTVRQNLRWALEKAPIWCSPKEKARCTAAAVMKEQP